VAGIDDWAWRKGTNYGTIIVDLERRQVVDLLADRSAATTASWFKDHPEVEVVSRDRAGLYADAARQGAPQARQVADRFHLLQNFRETVERQLGRFEAPISDSQVNARDNQATPPLPARSDCASDARRSHLQALAGHHQLLEIWAKYCPTTFASRAALVGAEIARLNGQLPDAERLYEEAIRSAREHGFIQNEGLANELAANFYAARGFETIAHAYLRNARSCYLRWGADGKVHQMDQASPQLRQQLAPEPTATVGAPAEQLDVGAVIKASQAVSGEIVLDRLIETLMAIALKHAGAQRGLLILLQGDAPRIEAEGRTDQNTVDVTVRQEAVTPADMPQSLLHTVIRMRQSVILDDASAQDSFSADEYVRERRARSILCLPLMKQAKLIGVLYLENNLASHVFTPARISILELLASQAAISLENARLYGELTVSAGANFSKASPLAFP